MNLSTAPHHSPEGNQVDPISLLLMSIAEMSGQCAPFDAVCLHDAILRPDLFHHYVRRPADRGERHPPERSSPMDKQAAPVPMEYYHKLQELRSYHSLLRGPDVRESYYDFRPFTKEIRQNANANGLARAKDLIDPERETFTTVAKYVGLAVNFHVTVLSVIACGIFLARICGMGIGDALIYGAWMGLAILGVEVALLVIQLSRENASET